MKASLRDIRDGIINSQSPYQQQTGLFSHLMSEERKLHWHRINLEHFLSIQNQSLSNIEQYIQFGIVSNAKNLQSINKNLSNINLNISLGFENIANNLRKTTDLLNNSNLILKGILEALITPETTKAKEKARLANQNIKDALNLRSDRAKILLDEAEDLLKESIKISPFDFRAHFDLGYLYSFYRRNFKKAEKNFNNAVLRSLSKDSNFATYSLRHLADARKHLGNLDSALSAIQEAYEINGSDYQIQFEYVQYLILNNLIDKANDLVCDLVGKNPNYFDISLTDPIIATENEILNNLFALRNEKIENSTNSLIEKYQENWNNKYVHTTLKNLFGKIKKDYSNIKLNDTDKYQIESFITREIEEKVNELTYNDLHHNKTQDVENHLNSFIQTELNSLLIGKGKKAFGSKIYLGRK